MTCQVDRPPSARWFVRVLIAPPVLLGCSALLVAPKVVRLPNTKLIGVSASDERRACLRQSFMRSTATQ